MMCLVLLKYSKAFATVDSAFLRSVIKDVELMDGLYSDSFSAYRKSQVKVQKYALGREGRREREKERERYFGKI